MTALKSTADPAINAECPPTADLWKAIYEWHIEAACKMAGEYDPKDECMFNGDTLHCRGWLDYLKAGRAGLVFSESGAGAEADDSWRDDGVRHPLAFCPGYGAVATPVIPAFTSEPDKRPGIPRNGKAQQSCDLLGLSVLPGMTLIGLAVRR